MDLGPLSSLYEAIPVDWLLIGGFTILVSLDVLRGGASRVVALALALPGAALLYSALPKAAVLGSALAGINAPYAQGIIFLALVLILFLIIVRIGLPHGGVGQPLQAAIAGIALAVIVISIWLQEPALVPLWHFGEPFQTWLGEAYRFWWLLASYMALGFASR